MKHDKIRTIRSMLTGPIGLPVGENEKIEIVRKGKSRSVLIEGIRRILLYGTDEMAFSMPGGQLVIHGKGLDCISYVSGAIGITGEIASLSFEEAGEG